MTRNDAARLLPVLRRHYLASTIWYVAIQATWIVALALLWFFGQFSRGAWLQSLGIPAVPLIFSPGYCSTIVFLVVHFRLRSRFRKLAANSEYRLCPHCCYDMTGVAALPDSSEQVQCPECGNPVNIAETEKLWRAWAT